MKNHSCDLLLPNGSRSSRVKSGTRAVCLLRMFHRGIVPTRRSQAPDTARNRSTGPLWHHLMVRASVVPSQTDSPEPIPAGYFPL